MSIRSSAIGLAVVVVLMGAGAAQSLAGSNTVFSDDIAPGEVGYSDLRENAVTSSRIANNGVFSGDIADNSVTGTDINESTIPGFKRVYFARVESNGTVAHGDPGTTASRTGTGLYRVYFPVLLNYACAGVASSRTQYSPPAIATTTVESTYVTVRQTVSATNTDRPFDLVVVCP